MESEIGTIVVACLRRTGAEFEGIAPGRAEEFAKHVAEAYSSLLATMRRLPEAVVVSDGGRIPVDRYGITWHLLWGAVSSMTAAWALLERGYPTEPLAVARQAMERLACAIVLFDNPVLVPGFVAGKLGNAFPARCLTPVRHVVREFGQTYGALCQLAAQPAPEVALLPITPASDPAATSPLSITEEAGSDGAARQHWSEMARLFCLIAQDILRPAAENVFFRTRRTAVLED